MSYSIEKDVYPKYVIYNNRVLRVSSLGALPEISQELEFEFLTKDHELIVTHKLQLVKPTVH